ncbi:MAG: NAD-dependent histone deacetylase sir2 [Chrysothrix sp. TS-e1954]|nr:MAG: NAD-dependent histone deacetylase sir2 [Chrysothrix sp. TS-e1954]
MPAMKRREYDVAEDSDSEDGSEDALEENGVLDDDYSDTESMLLDILNNEDSQSPSSDQDVCSLDEARRLKSRLRLVGPDMFVAETLTCGKYTAKRLLTAFGVKAPEFFENRADSGYHRLLGLAIVRELTAREKLEQYNDINDAVELLHKSKNVVVITGAGISTNLGVPDFRSKNTGFYDQMREKGFDSPEDIFDLDTFKADPRIFYENAGQTLAGPELTTPTHAFIKLLHDQGKLLTNYTQNIDNIEGNAGIPREHLIQCHGSWATFTCTKCTAKFPGSRFHEDVTAKRVPRCPTCVARLRAGGPATLKRKRNSHSAPRAKSKNRKVSHVDSDSEDDGRYDLPEPGVMKPDITFFGEKLPDTFFDRFKKHDRDIADLVIVIGTSMSVAPVSEIPLALPREVPHIYISRDAVRHINFDITFLGDCDTVVGELAKRAGWSLKHPMLKDHASICLKELDHDLAIWSIARPIQPSVDTFTVKDTDQSTAGATSLPDDPPPILQGPTEVTST